MTYYTCKKHTLLSLVFVAIFMLGACSAQQNADRQAAQYTKGQPNLVISQPLQLSAKYTLWGFVPTDTSYSPTASFAFQAYTNPSETALTQTAHTIVSTITQQKWQFALELSPQLGMLMQAKEKRGNVYETVQVLPVEAQNDFFSALYTANGKQVPALWIAKRWSSTPHAKTRVVREYREPASLCLQKMYKDAPQAKSSQIWASCADDLNTFSTRADAAFLFSQTPQLNETLQTNFTLPQNRPNFKKLVGEAEMNSSKDKWPQ